MKVCLILLICGFIIHSVLPTYYHKWINKKIIKSTNQKGIMLTFDDGPHPIHTPQLLDVLKENQVSATFFVVAEYAKQYPEVIKRISDEGHLIALHSLQHRNAWFYSYFYTKKDFVESIRIMEELGIKCHYYRPPWGHTNMFTSYFAKKNKLDIMLWNLMVGDWKHNNTSSIIGNNILKSINESSILCLHDVGHGRSADEKAPQRMIEALSQIVPVLKQQGYEFIVPSKGVTYE